MKMKLAKDSGHIHLPVYLNDKGPFDFTLDTGAGMTLISKAFADQLGFELHQGAKAQAVGVGGTPMSVKFVTASSLRVGTETFHDKEVAVIDFGSGIGACCLAPGILGHDILKEYILRIDYRAETVTFEKSLDSTDSEKSGIEWLPFRYVKDTHLMRIPVQINGQGPFELILDTGSSGMVITPLLATQLGMENTQTPSNEGEVKAQGCSQGTCAGPAGVAVGFGTTVSQLAVGTAVQEHMDVGVIDLRVITPKGDKIDYGVLGYPFLKNYTVVIDYPNRRFALIN